MAEHRVTLVTPEGERSFSCADDSFILDAAEDAGITDLPWGCRSGACASCVAKLVQGSVEHEDQFALDDHYIEAGFVLLCCSCPTSDVTIRTHASDELASA